MTFQFDIQIEDHYAFSMEINVIRILMVLGVFASVVASAGEAGGDGNLIDPVRGVDKKQLKVPAQGPASEKSKHCNGGGESN